jgi:tetraacyldisaccharide 4'-kinase
MKLRHFLLAPLAFCYGILMAIRNLLFDFGLLRSVEFDKPVISVGNLSFGGTGKTPHIEYLIRLLSPAHFVATLSRGYGRKSDGFIIASKRSNVKYIGDEPLQFAKKFEAVKVAVDEKRARGVSLLLQKYPKLDVILLDDAFQHRYVKPGLSILLTDYHQPYTEDMVLPSGTLREFKSGARRADVIVVTKTPKIFSPITRRRFLEDIRPLPHQKVLFSYIRYGNPVAPFDNALHDYPARVNSILLFDGIANDMPLREHLERMCTDLEVIKFADHHMYSEKDLLMIRKRFDDLPTQKKVMITTEKDFMRLKNPSFGNLLKNWPLFYIPIEIEFHGDDKESFENEVFKYVAKSKRNN